MDTYDIVTIFFGVLSALWISLRPKNFPAHVFFWLSFLPVLYKQFFLEQEYFSGTMILFMATFILVGYFRKRSSDGHKSEKVKK